MNSLEVPSSISRKQGLTGMNKILSIITLAVALTLGSGHPNVFAKTNVDIVHQDENLKDIYNKIRKFRSDNVTLNTNNLDVGNYLLTTRSTGSNNPKYKSFVLTDKSTQEKFWLTCGYDIKSNIKIPYISVVKMAGGKSLDLGCIYKDGKITFGSIMDIPKTSEEKTILEAQAKDILLKFLEAFNLVPNNNKLFAAQSDEKK